MKFSKILGECDPALVLKAEDMLSSCFTELALAYDMKTFGSHLGGDIFLYSMISTMPQICDARGWEFDQKCEKLKKEWTEKKIDPQEQEEIKQALKQSYESVYGRLLYTAATDGSKYYYAPQFITKLSGIGVRLIVGHEAWHSILGHSSRRGTRDPKLWNKIVDFKSNNILMEDLKARGIYYPEEVFRKEIGEYVNLAEYSAFLKDPFAMEGKLIGWNPIYAMKKILHPEKYPDNKEKSFYFAEPHLADDMRQPEAIYAYLMSCIPKCGSCGKMGIYKKPEIYKTLEKQVKEMQKDLTEKELLVVNVKN